MTIVLTSWWYLFEFGAAVGGTRFEPPAPKLTHSIHEKYNAPISAHQLDKAVRIAESAIDNWQITSIQFPSSPKSTLRFKGVGDNPLLRDRAHKVDIDPVTLEVIAVQSPDNMAWTNYINEYADPIHFGYFGGLATRAIWFIFGLGLTALSATGVMMTWKRTKSTALTKAQIRTLPVFAVSAICFVVWLSRYL